MNCRREGVAKHPNGWVRKITGKGKRRKFQHCEAEGHNKRKLENWKVRMGLEGNLLSR